MKPDNKRFYDMRGIITGREAIERYPNPRFFMRPDKSLTLEGCRAVLRRNCDEAERVVAMLRSTGNFKKKAPIIATANQLHDFRVSIGMFSAEFGAPYLWEE